MRDTLRACSLVCHSWVPRCRYHLIKEISVDSPDTLQSVAKILKATPGLPERVLELSITGHGWYGGQSWISSVPLHLPKLPNLRYLALRRVDFSQQHPEFPRSLSLFAPRDSRLCLAIHADELKRPYAPVRFAQLVKSLRAVRVYNSEDKFWIIDQKFMSRQRLNSWPRGLTARMAFRIAKIRELDTMGAVLHAWAFPVTAISMAVKDSLPQEGKDLSKIPKNQGPWRFWREIGRISTDLVNTDVKDVTSASAVDIILRLSERLDRDHVCEVTVKLFRMWNTTSGMFTLSSGTRSYLCLY